MENTQELESTETTESFEQEQSLDADQDKALFEDLGIDPAKYGLDKQVKEETQTDDGIVHEHGVIIPKLAYLWTRKVTGTRRLFGDRPARRATALRRQSAALW